jgi:hypothetical protein
MRLRGLHPVVRERADWAVRYAESQGVPVTITSVPEPYWPFWDAVKVYAGFKTYPQTDRVHGEYPGWRSVVKGWPKPTSAGWR